MTAAATVRAFWAAMRRNDWDAAARHLAPEFRGYWPQSGEVIDGPAAFAAVQAAFPGQGGWRFEEIALVTEGTRIVTDMRVTNPALDITARAITFHESAGSLIRCQTEFWPDAYDAPDWRRGLTRLDPQAARY